ncbi:MAG: hypothetical protein A2506_05800 [Elusimicrobia bacterium RIFOXYD12_FULL_66_9]|nr:MAG: hypothetical protein A2506_05800 [Elusimicrobia bacterium RIFOXYD12_FULL_66_9]
MESSGVECFSCGLIFEKWDKRHEKEKLEAQAALAALEKGPTLPASVDPWRGRFIAGAFLAVWLIGLTVAARHYMRTRRRPDDQSARAGDTMPVRDLSTGEVRRVKVQSARSR